MSQCLFISDIENGQYSLHFARNESVRAYYYNKQSVIVFNQQSETDIVRSQDNSILLRPGFLAFKDCMRHILKVNSSYFGASVEKTVDPLQKLLESGIECQFFKHSTSALTLNFTNVTLLPSTLNECTWKWIQDGANPWDGAFNITLHQSHEPSLNFSDQNLGLKSVQNSTEQDVMMALTCWLPSPASLAESPLMQKIRRKTMKNGEQNVSTKHGVTFAVPFILRKPFESKRIQLHPYAIVLDRNTSIAILVAVVSLVLLVSVAVVVYLFFKRKHAKR